MNDRKERVYSEEDLCEYTILQKIDELERQLQGIKNEFNGLYETKVDANNSHSTLSDNIDSVNNNLQVDINENARRIRDIASTVNNMNNIIPNDIGIKDNKLGLKNGNTWLTNLNAINIGDGLSYDETTNTLKASGGVVIKSKSVDISVNAKNYNVGDYVYTNVKASTYGASKIYSMGFGLVGNSLNFNIKGDCKFIPLIYNEYAFNEKVTIALICIKAGTVPSNATVLIEADFILQ